MIVGRGGKHGKGAAAAAAAAANFRKANDDE